MCYQQTGQHAHNIITHIANEEILLCIPCKSAIPLLVLEPHLYTTHLIPASERRDIVGTFRNIPVAKTFEDLKPRKDGSPPLRYLTPPVEGFQCKKCLGYKTVNWGALQRHAREKHNIRGCQKRDHTCFLQKWTIRNGYGFGSYWVVDISKGAISPQVATYLGATASELYRPSTEDEALMQMEAEEEERLQEEHHEAIALDEELEHDENSDWLRGCGWPTWFTNKPLSLIVAAAATPTGQDKWLGTWNGIGCISPAASERALLKLREAMQHVFQRCEETLQQTPHVLRC